MNFNSPSLHVAALASIAIAQPLFDLFGRAPEFLLAHDLGPAEILALVGILGVAVPAVFAIVVAVVERIQPTLGRVAAAVLVAFFVALVALYATKNIPGAGWLPVICSAAIAVTAAVLYYRLASARGFAAWLVPGIVVIPLLFLLRPGVQSLVWPQEQDVVASSASPIPVVVVVFDGLPLTALLNERYEIDRALYPSFAALADQSTWYRNATTVSDYTRWALPAILSGRVPEPQALPIASHHPRTIFSLLAASHTVEVHEPITRFCPQSLCDHGGEGVAHELMEFAEPLSVAYLHALLPPGIETRLPPIDQGWAEGIPPSENPGEVWLRGGDHSRRGEVLAFMNAIEPDGANPSLRFVHVLLPHVPLLYLPGGQRYGTERHLPGLLESRDRWVDDEWAVTQGYRRFLLQVGYVDKLLGQLMERLKTVGLYDRALVVVTADHGGSFRPDHNFRRVTDTNVADIAPIPLFIKAPDQQVGTVSHSNVETIDILPTIADIMNVQVPWPVDGVSAVANGRRKPGKTLYHDDARQVKHLPETLREAVHASVDRKLRLFDTGTPYLIPREIPYRDLIGRAVNDLHVSDAADSVEFALTLHGDFSHVQPDGEFLPAYLAGRASWRDIREPAVVAAAINGTVRATTRAYPFSEHGVRDTWSLLLPPDAFRAGENSVEIFVVRPSSPPVLHRTHFSHAGPVDLLSNAAAYGMRVATEGVYDREGTGDGAIRWTNGEAAIVVPRNDRPSPLALRINLATAGPVEKGLIVSVNGCEVFDGKVPSARWSGIFGVGHCQQEESPNTVIELRSATHLQSDNDRPLGVALERLDLLHEAWPPPTSPLPEAGRRSQIRFRGTERDGDTVGSTHQVAIGVINRGTSIWAGPADLGQENGAVRLGVLWFDKGQTARPAAVQRVELPRPLIPGDSIDFTFDLVPQGTDGKLLPPGEYEAWIGMLQEGVSWFYTSGDSVRKLRVIHDARP